MGSLSKRARVRGIVGELYEKEQLRPVIARQGAIHSYDIVEHGGAPVMATDPIKGTKWPPEEGRS